MAKIRAIKRNSIPRRRHLHYVLRPTITLCVCGFVLGIGLLSLSVSPGKADELLAFGLIILLPVGILLGVATGLALHRLMLVKHVKYDSNILPFTKPAKVGRTFGPALISVAIVISTVPIMFAISRPG